MSESIISRDSSNSLKRSLSLPLITFYGLGTILGTGIYVLIGKIVGIAGIYAPFAFLLAAVLAFFTAFSYAELSSRYPSSAGAALYVEKAFSKRWLSTALGWSVVLTGIVSAGTMVNGFVGYLTIIISLIRLVCVGNGALVQIIMASRVVYGMSRQDMAPSMFNEVNNRTQTPIRATMLITLLILVLALWLPLVTLAKATSFIILVVFALVNLSLCYLKLGREPHPDGTVNYPLWIPILGFLLCLGLLILQVFSSLGK